jgi:hypothetical protein
MPLFFASIGVFAGEKGVRFEWVVSANPFVFNKLFSSFPLFSIFFRLQARPPP